MRPSLKYRLYVLKYASGGYSTCRKRAHLWIRGAAMAICKWECIDPNDKQRLDRSFSRWVFDGCSDLELERVPSRCAVRATFKFSEWTTSNQANLPFRVAALWDKIFNRSSKPWRKAGGGFNIFNLRCRDRRFVRQRL